MTGCAGFIGSHLTDALLGRGDEVVGLEAFRDYYPRPLKESNLAEARARAGFALVEQDVAEAPLAELLGGVDGVFHLAAQAGVRASWGDSFSRYLHDNLHASQRLFEAAARAGARVVFASSSSVYGDAEAYPTREDAPPRPVSPYGMTKLGCEHLAYAYAGSHALDAVVLRYFSVYGPRQRPDMAIARVVAALSDGLRFEVYGSGEQSRDFTFAADAVAATLTAMERGRAGAVYNVGGGSEATLREVIAACERLSGRRLDVEYREAAAGDALRTSADTRKLRAELGWRPRTGLEDGLAAQLTWAGLSSAQ